MSHTPLSVMHMIPGARVVGDLAHQVLHRVHSDTRTLEANDCFVALRGDRFDGHTFLPELADAEVRLALAQEGLASSGLSGVEVRDTRVALGEWAKLWREQMAMPVIAITGSNGKTTVTQMVAHILRQAYGAKMHATQGNYNNDIGVPLTVLGLRGEQQAAVIELGMNHPGEIDGLARIAQPNVALVNNAQREHQEFMSSVQAVAEENASVFAHLRSGGVGVFPHGDAFHELWKARLVARSEQVQGCQAWTFGIDQPEATVWAHARWQQDHWEMQVHTPMGDTALSLAMAGRHNVMNALAALTCALAAGVSLNQACQGLQLFQPVPGRSRLLQVCANDRDIPVVDDTYNANPDSVLAAIAVLSSLPKPQWLVLGDMGEVGQHALAYHQEVLQAALQAEIDRIDVTGDWMTQAAQSLAPTAAVQAWPSAKDLAEQAPTLIKPMGSALIKGSRFMRMEQVLNALTAASQERTPHAA